MKNFQHKEKNAPPHMEKMASKNSAKRTTKPSLPKKGEKRPFTWRKRPQLEGERPPEIEIVFFMLEGRAPTLPPPCGCIWK